MTSGNYRRTKAHREAISKTLRGHYVSTESRAKMRSARLGKKHTIETRKKISAAHKGRKRPNGKRKNQWEQFNVNWKGDNAGYSAVHKWLYRRIGKAKTCAHCKKKVGYIDWANIDHKYRRDANDWLSLCRSCHRQYDRQYLGEVIFQ